MRNGKRTIQLTQREIDIIIAALRLWQRVENEDQIGDDLMEIAKNGREGDYAYLLDDQIDALIEERLN